MRCVRRATWLLTAVVLLLGGVVQVSAQEGPSGSRPDADLYRVGIGDVLNVVTFQRDEVSGQFPVEEGGVITFPLLDRVEVAGKSLSEVADLLERLLERDYYVDVQVQVGVEEYLSRPVTVLGEVSRPGTYYLRGRTTLSQVLAQAGGLRPTAGSVVELRRRSVDDGTPRDVTRTFSVGKLLAGDQSVEVRAGDVVSVAPKRLYFVSGEVVRPGQYELEPGMTLMQAIAQAGGLAKFASEGVELHRDSLEGKQILKYNLGRIEAGKEDDPLIRPSDMIIVKRRFF